MLWLSFAAVVAVGIAGLIIGADRFVTGAGSLARNLGVSPLTIGLTVVSLGTSLPELLVTVTATLTGHPNVGVGNVIGSNISNIGLILGASSIVRPLMIHSQLLQREYPVLLFTTGLVWLLAANGVLSRFEGFLLTAGLVVFLIWTVRTAKEQENDPYLVSTTVSLVPAPVPLRSSLTNLLAGLVVLLIGSRLLIWGSVNIATAFGVSELVIGLTLVALGTSLPELAVTLAGSVKKEDDIAVGNIIGSNIFNLMGILGIPAIIHPLPVSSSVLYRDFPVMLLATLALWPICKDWKRRHGRVNRFEGSALLIGYIIYITVLFI